MNPSPDSSNPVPAPLAPEDMVNYLARWMRGQQQVFAGLLATITSACDEMQTTLRRLQDECEKARLAAPPRPLRVRASAASNENPPAAAKTAAAPGRRSPAGKNRKKTRPAR
ncbi:hypothetical protein Ga0100231_005235 [Opitutaceae bacterium TAV4]|nr:hypothetical protein Ga0100231_005235 [Opitutaceae bacterium TAV4]RRK02392.1 hypothetical protein Ga0100230_004355 [Opitutaceae bacterium TAV3]